MTEEDLQHAIDMVYVKGYSAAYYLTILYNLNAKHEGKPLMNFDPKDPEAVFRTDEYLHS
jgi:hypothetical protein